MFQAAPEAGPPAATGGQVGDLPHAPGEFTRIFGGGELPAAQAPTPAPSAGPGEYTRMFSAQPAPQPTVPATPTPAPAPVGAKKVPWLTVALIVAVVLLLAVVAIMAFALRK